MGLLSAVSHGCEELARVARATGVLFGVCALVAGLAEASDPRAPVLEIEQMIFVAAQGGENRIRVHADRARLDTSREIAALTGVETTISDPERKIYFEMTCERGELDLASNDFLAEGRVSGRTRSGISFETEWVRYDHDQGLLLTDSPVLITESFGTYRGGGFRYDVRNRRLRLLGGASLVQDQ